jgi:hypothetical protein
MPRLNRRGLGRNHRMACDAPPTSQRMGITLCLGGIIGALACVLPGIVTNGYADPGSGDLRASLVMLQPGEVTANNGGGDLVIDNQRYMVLASVTVMDDEGRPRNINELVPGTQVRFRLRNEKIDQLVMMLPR